MTYGARARISGYEDCCRLRPGRRPGLLQLQRGGPEQPALVTAHPYAGSIRLKPLPLLTGDLGEGGAGLSQRDIRLKPRIPESYRVMAHRNMSHNFVRIGTVENGPHTFLYVT
jgi:hypothetical protein